MSNMIIPATDLKPGDQWVIDKARIVIENVSRIPAIAPDWPRGAVLIHGCILRGVGRGLRRRWTLQPEQSLDIERAGRAS
jgi:hypothetical protein